MHGGFSSDWRISLKSSERQAQTILVPPAFYLTVSTESLLLGPGVHDSLDSHGLWHSGRLYLTVRTGYPFCLVQVSITALMVTLFYILVVFT